MYTTKMASGLIAYLITVLVATFLIYWLWNEVLVRTTTFARPIDFWQSLGVAVLARLLFGPNVVSEQALVVAMPKNGKAVKRSKSRSRR